MTIADTETISQAAALEMAIDALILNIFTPRLVLTGNDTYFLRLKTNEASRDHVFWGKCKDREFLHKMKMIVSANREIPQEMVMTLIKNSTDLQRFKR